MTFNVFAKNMFCGTLTITSSGLHMFRNRHAVLEGCNSTVSKKISSYPGLRLERIL